MAYLARIETTGASEHPGPTLVAPGSTNDGFTTLEWLIIRDSRSDGLWTIRPLGAVRRMWHWWLGRGSPKLANERLEALRTIAVLSWNFGFTVPGQDVEDFLAAGFSADQYELLVSRITESGRHRPTRFAQEARA